MVEASDANSPEWIEDRRRYVLDTAEQAASGTIRLLLAVHEIWKWLFALPELTRLVTQKDIDYLKWVCDRSCELPLSTERQYWADKSLREKDLIAQKLEQEIREDVLAAFARIVNDIKRML